MNALTTMAGWAAETGDDHGPLAFERARAATIDTIACVIAGAHDPATTAAREALAGWGQGPATAIGSGHRRPVPWAALINGTAADALDFDDYDAPAASHPSAAILPALIALGEERRSSGRAVLDAFIIGLEIQMRVGEAINMSHFQKGFHPTATIGSLASAVGCARLMGLDALATANALSIATSLAAGFKSQLGTTTIHLHTGFAAHNGVVAAGLAAVGASGSSAALEGPYGTLDVMADGDAAGFEAPLAKLGSPLAIEEFGLHVKPYPCCSYSTAAIDGLLSLRAEHALEVGDITSVTAFLPAHNMDFLKFPEPRDEMEARFSMEYCLAVALRYGAVTLADFTPPAVARSSVRELVARVVMEPLEAGPDAATDGKRQAETVCVRLTDGREITREIGHVKGSPEHPLSDAEMTAKFDSCVKGALTSAESFALMEVLTNLCDLGDIRDLTRHLPGAASAHDPV